MNAMSKAYASIVEHYRDCLARHGDSHLGVNWPNPRDAERRYQVMLELIRKNRHGKPIEHGLIVMPGGRL